LAVGCWLLAVCRLPFAVCRLPFAQWHCFKKKTFTRELEMMEISGKPEAFQQLASG
jgi:hypothetical protein